jgi:sortase (surface protein transpeptidase)
MPKTRKKPTSKQSAPRGLLRLWPKPASSSRSRKRNTTFLGLPIHLIQPLLFAVIVINAVFWTVFQYNLTHSQSVITKIPAPSATVHRVAHTKVLPKSIPTHLRVPLASVDTDIIQIGQNADGTIELPTSYDIVGWYKYGPTPGELGPAIIVGHVDSYKGLAVFWYLKDLKTNDEIDVNRTDGSVAKFVVAKVEEVSQDSFPTDEVYGPINYAGIRLITCGGEFSHATGRYNHNIVVFGKLQ